MTDSAATNASSAIALVPQKGAFDEAVKRLCFEIWLFLADRNAEDTVRLLTEQLADVAPGTLPALDRIPSIRTVQNWAKIEKWDQKANDLIREMAPEIDESQISRLFLLSEKALNWAHRLLDGQFDSEKPGILAVKATLVKEMLQFRGLGTAGALGAPTLQVKIENTSAGDVIQAMSLEDKAEFMRQRILEGKQQKRLTGKASKA